MKKIIFIRESIDGGFGGIEHKIVTIAKYLYDKKIFYPMLITSPSHSNNNFIKEFKRQGFPVIQTSMRGINTFHKSYSSLKKILFDKKIVLIQSHGFRESLLGRFIRMNNNNKRHIFRVHTHIDGSEIPLLKNTLYHLLDRITSNYVDAFIPISNTLKNELIVNSKIPPDSIFTVYNGINQIGPPDEENLNESPLNKEVALIGDFQERKQQATAVEAIGILNSKNIKIKLHLFGSVSINNYISLVKQKVNKYNIKHLVHFHDFQSQERIYELIKKCPVFILPSLFEGVPTSIIEGMSLRKLVVSTPVGATCELIKDNYNGLLHPPRDPISLANILENIFTSPAIKWETIRNKGYKIWKENFTAEQMMNGLINVYRDLGVLH